MTQGRSTWYSGLGSSMLSSDSWLANEATQTPGRCIAVRCSSATFKPVIGSGGLSSSRFATMYQKSTAHEQRRSRGESRKLRFGSNRRSTAPKI